MTEPHPLGSSLCAGLGHSPRLWNLSILCAKANGVRGGEFPRWLPFPEGYPGRKPSPSSACKSSSPPLPNLPAAKGHGDPPRLRSAGAIMTPVPGRLWVDSPACTQGPSKLGSRGAHLGTQEPASRLPASRAQQLLGKAGTAPGTYAPPVPGPAPPGCCPRGRPSGLGRTQPESACLPGASAGDTEALAGRASPAAATLKQSLAPRLGWLSGAAKPKGQGGERV